jgi:bifunctional UDP-N-acetylglucosamine pyrophosphorylase / glucosamine-1-phosphate N-acetyltransferase
MAKRSAVILAAGQGTRMKSPLPKVLHPLAGRPMLAWALANARAAGCEEIAIVVGPHFPEVGRTAAEWVGTNNVFVQSEPLGTGHAALAAEGFIRAQTGECIILFADTPLTPPQALAGVFDTLEAGAGVTVLGFEAADPGGYGRLLRNEAGDLVAIREAKDASPEERAVTLCNSGVLGAKASDMVGWLKRVTNDNAKGEYYLTDLVELARADGRRAAVVTCAEADVLGVNSQAELAKANAAFQVRKRAELLAAGVMMDAPETVFFAFDTQIGPGTRIEPNVVFGPNVIIAGGAWVRAFSHIEGAIVEAGAEVGPYARLRPGAKIGAKAKIGNFVEVKNVTMGDGAKANHLAYLGDGTIGKGANIGAGTIFCNYDGFAKHKTEIGEGAFVGSNSSLVAPVQIGAGAYVGSGSVITKPVSADALAVARGRQSEIEGWAKRFREKMASFVKAKAKQE